MNQIIKNFIRDYLKFLFLFGLPWFYKFFENIKLGQEGSIILFFTLFLVFSLCLFNLSLKLVKSLGKENIYSLFYAVPLSVVYFPYAISIAYVGDKMVKNYYFIENIRDFLYYSEDTGLNYLILYFIAMFMFYKFLKE